MAQDLDPAAIARAIIDANLYMVVGTADATGLPWVSPVYYTPIGYREFLWLSSPDARHSRNIQARPEVGIVIFDSSVPINAGQGVYMSAVAQQLDGSDVTTRSSCSPSVLSDTADRRSRRVTFVNRRDFGSTELPHSLITSLKPASIVASK